LTNLHNTNKQSNSKNVFFSKNTLANFPSALYFRGIGKRDIESGQGIPTSRYSGQQFFKTAIPKQRLLKQQLPIQ